jgi:hypothetical protein
MWPAGRQFEHAAWNHYYTLNIFYVFHPDISVSIIYVSVEADCVTDWHLNTMILSCVVLRVTLGKCERRRAT